MSKNETSAEIMYKIYPDKGLIEFLEKYLKQHRLQVNFYNMLCRSGRWEPALGKNPQFKLCLVYVSLPMTLSRYQAAGISENIFWDTMDDIRIWIDDYKSKSNKYGLDELNWIMLHMTLKIFKLGRLQFQPIKYYFPKPYKFHGRSVKFGDRVINLHIPRGEKLALEACRDSFKKAESFFSKKFPKYPTDFFVCHSWLLYSKNKLFMKSDSNIVKFADMFDIVCETENPSQAYRWIFGERCDGIKQVRIRKKHGSYELPKSIDSFTSLQSSAVCYIKNGGTLGDAMAITIVKNN